ncbi:MAG TPA: type II toxin-antitoxin system VapC family toxin [Terriglobales bacterium]|nr:type II toxin-antitoxin system VapC family toxin [Terriglobales bacterium]
MAPIYLDTSAVNKLILAELESDALVAFLADWPERIASALVVVETGRAIMRATTTGRQERARIVLAGLNLLPMDAPMLERAATTLPANLRSLNAIHLASALSIPGLAGMVVYDRRLAAAAAHHGLQVWSPGRPAAG